jgi:hypothetical protein
MSTKRVNSASVIDVCTQRLNALRAHLSSTKATIAVNGVQTKAAEIIATYQASLDGRATLNSQRADVKATLVTVAASDTKRRVVDRALKAWVVNQYGADSKEAHDFGFPPPKAPERTVSSKATALERSEATRQARHTMGSRQKEDVKGTAVVLVAPANPATTVQPAAPAASAPSTTTATTQAPAAPAPAPSTTNGVSSH